jgi:hypothetical protein
VWMKHTEDDGTVTTYSNHAVKAQKKNSQKHASLTNRIVNSRVVLRWVITAKTE